MLRLNHFWINKNNRIGEEALPQRGWNTLDCDSEYQYSFTTYQGNSKLITEIDRLILQRCNR